MADDSHLPDDIPDEYEYVGRKDFVFVENPDGNPPTVFFDNAGSIRHHSEESEYRTERGLELLTKDEAMERYDWGEDEAVGDLMAPTGQKVEVFRDGGEAVFMPSDPRNYDSVLSVSESERFVLLQAVEDAIEVHHERAEEDSAISDVEADRRDLMAAVYWRLYYAHPKCDPDEISAPPAYPPIMVEEDWPEPDGWETPVDR